MKLPPRLKRILWATLVIMYGTGLVTWWLNSPDDLATSASASRKWWLESHSVVSLWFIGLFGYLLHSHVLVAWRRRKKILSGLTVTISFLLLMATVPVLFYASSDSWRASAAWLHTYLGLLLVAPFLLHYFLPTRD